MTGEATGGASALRVSADALFEQHRDRILQRTDQMFAWLMLGQWFFGILLAIVLSPYAWAGRTSTVHAHVYAAVFLGGALSGFPIALIKFRAGHRSTRYVVAVSQMLWSALLIHLSGGRIETHFHVFVSLAILAFYRDWKVLVPAALVVITDHFMRGLLWPQSVYGIANPESWRFLEHGFWVAFEVTFLMVGIAESVREMREIAARRAGQEAMTALVEGSVGALRTAVQVRDDFLAVAGHELKTPLAGMLLQIQGLQRLVQKDPAASIGPRLEKASGSGLKMERLINQLLDVSKIAAGRLNLEPEPFDLSELVKEVAALFENADGPESRITTRCAGQVRGRWDRARIEQVITNLVGNAMKYGQGKPVEIDLRAENGEAILRVADHGIGIDSDHQKKIFQKFERAVATREFGGFGLGLWITRQIVTASAGRVEVQSTAGQGSVFTVRLPMEQHQSAHEERGAAE